MEKILQRRNRVNLQDIQYQSRAEQLQAESTNTQDEDVDVSFYEKVRNEVRSYIQNDYELKKVMSEATLNPKKKPEFIRIVNNYITSERKVVPGMTQQEIIEKIWQDLCSLGPLDEVLKNDDYNEVMLNGYDQPWVQYKGEDIPAHDIIKFDSKRHFETTVITKILNNCGKSVSEAKPLVDARVGDARVSIVWSPISQMKGPIVSIRKFPPINLSPEGFLNYGTSSKEMLEFMKLCVIGGCSIAMGGATGSGKTTTYKMMAGFVPKGQRTIVIEDTAEMRLETLYPYEEGFHFLSEECRIQGDSETDITIQHLLETAMRQKPERIIVGEIRRAVDLLSAIEFMNSGHPLWFTAHARTAKHFIQKMIMMLRRADPSMGSDHAQELLADSLDIIMMQKLYKKDKKRRVFEIVEVAGLDEHGRVKLNPIFEFNTKTRQFEHKNPISEKLIEIFVNAEIPEEDFMPFVELPKKTEVVA